MADSANGGFTIIELILFLALTGLFMMIALNGVGGRSGQVQFTDAMRSLSSYLQRQYSDTLNGVNTRSDFDGCSYDSGGSVVFSGDGPGRSQCTTLGKLVVFGDAASEAHVYVIVGRFLTQTVGSSHPNYLDPSLSDEDLLDAADPVVLTSRLNTAYEIEWQTAFVDTTGSDPTAIGFIRSPRSSSIYPLTFTPNWTQSDPSLDISSLGADARYCFLGANGQDAEIIMGGSNQADGVALEFDTGCSS